MMTQMKERAVELIERIPDEKMFYVINILQNLEEMSSNRPADKKQAMEALQNVLKFSGRLPHFNKLFLKNDPPADIDMPPQTSLLH